MAVEVGAGYVSIYPDTSSFKSEISKALEGDFSTGGQKASKGFFSAFDIGLGTFLGNMGTNLFGSMMGNLSTAMNRLDTLTNYPKVMQGFGYSAEQAQESIDLIMDRLVGLPTTTQEMVQFTQALADSTGDLDLATRGALAFNDAMLASGASTADQTRAQRIFNRIVGSGTTTTQQWAALMSVMPLQLGMTAEAMLGAGAGAQDLGKALMDGTVSINDILAAMVKLDEEGLNGMDSFNEQAWNMAFTLETALGLIPTRISNALAAIGQELGRDNLMAPFLGIADGIKDMGNQIVSGIQWVKQNFGWELVQIQGAAERVGFYIGLAMETIGGILQQVFAAATPVVLQFAQGAMQTFADVLKGVWKVVQTASPSLQVLADIFGGALYLALQLIGGVAWIAGQALTAVLGYLADNAPLTNALVAGLAAGFTAWAISMGVAGLAGIIPSILGLLGSLAGTLFRLWSVLMANPIVAVIALIAGIVTAIVTWIQTTEEGAAWWNNFCETASAVFQAFGDLVGYVVGNIVDFFTSLPKKIGETWDNIKKAASKAWKNISNVISNLVKGLVGAVLGAIGGLASSLVAGWNGIKSTASTAWDGIKTLASTAWNGIKSTITGIVDGTKTALSTAWDNMKSAASTAWNGIKTTASTVWGNIKTTIGNLVDGIKTGAKGAWDTMTTNAKGAWETMKSNASTIFGGIQSTLGGIWDKITGKTSSSVTSMQNSVNSFKGKSVTVGVAKAGGFDGVIRSAQSAINSIQGRTVGINLHVYKSGISGLAVEQSYSRLGVSKVMARAIMAKGGTIYEPTWALIGEAGYNETVIPNTPWGVRPLASMIAEEMGNTKSSGVVVTGNTFVVRNDQDITRVANQLNNMISRQTGGRL